MSELLHFDKFWVYLAATPLAGLTLTLCAYLAAQKIFVFFKGSTLANPVAIAIGLVALVLSVSGMSYQTYFDGAQFVHFLLGPATVALAVPLVQQFPRLRRSLGPLMLALFAGCVTTIVSSVVVALALGATPKLAITLAPKGATSPIAMAVAERLGGMPSLIAALAIGTGIVGAIIAPFVYRLFAIRSDMARGFALGLAAHGVGTARAFQISSEMGAFSGLAMGLNGALTAVLAPVLVPPLLQLFGYGA